MMHRFKLQLALRNKKQTTQRSLRDPIASDDFIEQFQLSKPIVRAIIPVKSARYLQDFTLWTLRKTINVLSICEPHFARKRFDAAMNSEADQVEFAKFF